MKAKYFLTLLITFLLGSLFSPFFNSDPMLFLILGSGFIASSFIIFRKRFFWLILFSFGVFFLSVAGYQKQEIKYIDLNKSFVHQAEFTAKLNDLPVNNEFGEKLSLKILSINGELVNYKSIAYKTEFPVIEVGQVIKFTGEIKPYDDKKRTYLIKEKVIGEINLKKFEVVSEQNYSSKDYLLLFRQKMNNSLAKSLPVAEANLASGLILGEKSLITAEFKRELQASGTSHIIALSGYNITIILSLFIFMRKRFSRLANLAVPIAFIVAFIVMTGGAASIVRAAIMGMMPIFARYLGRPANTLIAIIFSASIMVLLNPFLLLHDVGFQLSFAAMIGLSYISPQIMKLFKAENMVFVIFSETVGAQLAVLPLLIYYFGQFSIISPISNLLILGLVPLGMLVSFTIAVAGLLSALLGNFFGLIGFIVLKSINYLISFFGNMPNALWQIKVDNPIWIFLLYFLMFDLIFFFGSKKGLRQQP